MATLRLLWVAAAATVLVLTAANAIFTDLNQDEGWYLYTAQEVARGALPYRDFHFSQGPLIPYAYAALRPFWEPGGVLGGRWVTALLGWIGVALAAATAWRAAPHRYRHAAALSAVVLAGVNVYQSQFTTIVKSYALASVCVTGAFLALAHVNGRRPRLAAAGAAVLLACAVGVRFSMIALFPPVGAYLLWQRRRVGHPLCWLVFGVAGGVAGAALFLPWLLECGDAFGFSVGMHTGRRPGPDSSWLVFKAGFVSRFVRAYFVALAAGLAALMLGPRRRGTAADEETGPPHFAWLLVAAVGCVSLLHLSAAVPYDDYQVPVFPLLALAAALLVWRGGARAAWDANRSAAVLWLLVIGSGLAAFSSPINQAWFVHGRDRIWWLSKPKPQVLQLKDAARRVREAAAPGHDLLLTQDTYLAVEAGMRVPRALTMGPFSYFPGLGTDEATRFHVLNEELMVELLRTTPATVAAFSGYGLAFRMPSVTPIEPEARARFQEILESRYVPVADVPCFGQGQTTLRLWQLRR